MLNKSILLPILFACAVLISGCIEDGQKQVSTPESVILKTNLPPGFTYEGVHEIPMEIGGTLMNATEGIYRYGENDIYIQIIENDSPAALLARYKKDLREKFKNDYDPFEDVSFNGHKATKYTDYSRITLGKQKPGYRVIWASDKYMIDVFSSEAGYQAVLTLAAATGI